MFQGEIAKAPGDARIDVNSAEIILFTTDSTILNTIAEHDDTLRDEIESDLRASVAIEPTKHRPTTRLLRRYRQISE